jgi:hypothetical protein
MYLNKAFFEKPLVSQVINKFLGIFAAMGFIRELKSFFL